MEEKTTQLNHVALQYKFKKDAETFFTKILKIPLKKEFTLNAGLSQKIFKINENVNVQVYDNGKTKFEIFYSNAGKKHGFEHTSIEIDNKEKFITNCKKYNIKPFTIQKENKKLLFVKDNAGNLFEIIQKK